MKAPKTVDYVHNGMINVPNVQMEYRGYVIVPKRDMGNSPWLINGNSVRRGYVITQNGVNVMPGATWACSLIEAKVMIDTLEETNDKDGSAKTFWDLWNEKQGLSEYEDV